MELLERFNNVMDYVEENIDGEIRFEEAARIAYCSVFHFQRMFAYITGILFSEYIRRRRMTCAAFDLQNDEKVIDVALKYGYDSPTAFNRAFKSVHGVPPSMAKELGVTLKNYPRFSFRISIIGDTEMNYRIEKREEFRIVGVKERCSMNVEESFKQVPLFWQKTNERGVIPELCELMNGKPEGVLGICAGMDGESFDYYIAVVSDKKIPAGKDFVEYTVPAGTWAVFECVGPMPKAIQELEKRIVTEWLPNSGYEYADAPDIEVYPNSDTNSPDYRCEVWFPVKRK